MYRKIPKISPEAHTRWGLSMEGNLPFKVDWASLILGRKFTVFAFFYFVLRGNFQLQVPEGLIFVTSLGALIFGGAYTWGLIFGILRYNNLLCMKIDGKKRCKKGATNKNLILAQD